MSIKGQLMKKIQLLLLLMLVGLVQICIGSGKKRIGQRGIRRGSSNQRRKPRGRKNQQTRQKKKSSGNPSESKRKKIKVRQARRRGERETNFLIRRGK